MATVRLAATLIRFVLTPSASGYARPDSLCPIDLPDDYFRIRLVCNLLETVGEFFDKGVNKKKLDFFLAFLQVSFKVRILNNETNNSKYYIQVKDPVPMDIDFVIQDAYAHVRPQWKLATNLEDASRIFAEGCKQNYQNIASERATEPAVPDEMDASDDDVEKEPLKHGANGDQSSGDEVEVLVIRSSL